MSDSIISPNDAGLLLHKFVTEAVPVLAYFDSADQFITAKFSGFVVSFTQAIALVLSTASPLAKPDALPAYIRFSHDFVAASRFTYADETTMPAVSEALSGELADVVLGV